MPCYNVSVGTSQPLQGACINEEFSRVQQKQTGIHVGCVLVELEDRNSILLPIANVTDDPITLYKGTNIGLIQIIPAKSLKDETSEHVCCCKVQVCQSGAESEELKRYVDQQDHLSAQQKQKLRELQQRYRYVLSSETNTSCAGIFVAITGITPATFFSKLNTFPRCFFSQNEGSNEKPARSTSCRDDFSLYTM